MRGLRSVFPLRKRGIEGDLKRYAWGRLPLILRSYNHQRNTPTSVGKTLILEYQKLTSRKYPHEP